MTGRPRIIVSVDRTWVHLLGLTRFTYHRLIRRAGGRPFNIKYPLTEPDATDRRRMIERLDESDGLLLAGGGDVDPALSGVEGPAKNVNPARDRFELTLLEQAVRRRMPVLGICRGMQLMNVQRGGTLRSLRDDPTLRRTHSRMRNHPVTLTDRTTIHRIVGRHELPAIRSLHGQAVDRPGDDLTIAAAADDGVTEAIESRQDADDATWFVGVQWHPELMLFDQPDHALIRAFVDAAHAWSRSRKSTARRQ